MKPKQTTREEILATIAYWQKMAERATNKIWAARCDYHIQFLESKLRRVKG